MSTKAHIYDLAAVVVHHGSGYVYCIFNNFLQILNTSFYTYTKGVSLKKNKKIIYKIFWIYYFQWSKLKVLKVT